jgi:hypothetical protein
LYGFNYTKLQIYVNYFETKQKFSKLFSKTFPALSSLLFLSFSFISLQMSRAAPGTPRASKPCDHAAALFLLKYLAARVQRHYLYLFVPFQLAHDCKASINQSITPAS